MADSRAPVPAAGGEASFLHPRVLFPFLLITLIWGSTWIVIRDQLTAVPATWSVTYRFVIASAAMFAVARLSGASLRIGREGHVLALAFGLPQFFLNFNFVYAAEHYVTSGIVAVVFALLLVPNSALGWLFLKHRLSSGFLTGSTVAVGGVGLLFLQELRMSEARAGDVLLGIGFALAAVLAASAANILQVSERMRGRPVAAMLAWGMFYGTLADAATALFLHGAPSFESRPGYWAGLVYLGLFASALTFSIYFRILRMVGPARAAYSSVVIPVVAMGLSTLFEGYRWSALAAAGGLLVLTGLVIALRSSRPAVA